MYDPERVLMQAASSGSDARTVEGLVLDALAMVHGGDALSFGTPESAFGWTFYPISIARSAIRTLASLPDSDVLRIRGDSIEQKFVNWLNLQAKKKGLAEQIHFALASDLRSSRYGLF